MQQDISNTRKRLSQNFTKMKSKTYFLGKKNGLNYDLFRMTKKLNEKIDVDIHVQSLERAPFYYADTMI